MWSVRNVDILTPHQRQAGSAFLMMSLMGTFLTTGAKQGRKPYCHCSQRQMGYIHALRDQKQILLLNSTKKKKLLAWPKTSRILSLIHPASSFLYPSVPLFFVLNTFCSAYSHMYEGRGTFGYCQCHGSGCPEVDYLVLTVSLEI